MAKVEHINPESTEIVGGCYVDVMLQTGETILFCTLRPKKHRQSPLAVVCNEPMKKSPYLAGFMLQRYGEYRRWEKTKTTALKRLLDLDK